MLSEKNRRRFWFMYFVFVLFMTLNAYVMLGRWMAENKLHALQIEGRPYISDFVSFYGSGVLARQCLSLPTRIYDGKAQFDLESKLTAPVIPEAPFSNPNTPVTFVTLLPLSFFDINGAWIAWALVTTSASIAVILWAFSKELKHWFAKAIALLGFLLSYGTWFSIRLGSTSCLLFPMVLAFWQFMRQKRCIAAAAMACVATVKVQYAPFLLAIGLARFGWKFLAFFAGFCAVLIGICTAVLGWDNVAQFPNALILNETTNQIVGVQADKMQNLRGLLVLITGSDSKVVHYVCAAVWIMVAACMFALWKRVDVENCNLFNLLAGATTLLMLVSSPHTHMQDYILAVITCLMFYFASEHSSDLDARDRIILKVIAVSFPCISWIFYVYLVELNAFKIQPFALWAFFVSIYASRIVFRRLVATLKPPESTEKRISDEEQV